MFFHRTVAELGFAPPGPASSKSGVQKVEVDPIRVAVSIGSFVILIAAAIVCHVLLWEEGAKSFLHLVEVTGGGLVGLFVGENSSLKTQAKTGAS
jgi:hypothetical protein